MIELYKEQIRSVFNEICRGLLLNEQIHIAVDDVLETPSWGPMDPLAANFIVQFKEDDKKYFRMVFQRPVLEGLINQYITSDKKVLYDILLTEYKKFHLEQGPGEDSEKDLAAFYREFDERGNTYNNTVRIFFTACKMIKKYKNIILIPRSFDSSMTLDGMISWDDPLGIKPPKKTFYFRTDALSNIAAGQSFPPDLVLCLEEKLFDTQPLETDPESIKSLIGKADEITYAAARVMIEVCKQLRENIGRPRFFDGAYNKAANSNATADPTYWRIQNHGVWVNDAKVFKTMDEAQTWDRWSKANSKVNW